MKPLIFALALGTGAAILPSCYATADTGYVTEESPPAPQYETVEVRPGFVFVHGHWSRDHGRWAWQTGRYERERHGYRFVDGRWERRGNRHVWVDGQWRAEGGVVVR